MSVSRLLWLLLSPLLLLFAFVYVRAVVKRGDPLVALILPFFAVVLLAIFVTGKVHRDLKAAV
jgi:membrane protein YdbS with pleckstrin-like domain